LSCSLRRTDARARRHALSALEGPRRYTGHVDATPLLSEVARRLNDVHLEAVLIGNAGAALQGAPVTTVDFDFLYRKTPRNLIKLKRVADALQAMILRPYYPASDLYRVVRDDDGLQVDFMSTIHGIRSFAGVRDRATRIEIGGASVLVASLSDIIASKRAARRPRDLAVLDVLEAARAAEGSKPSKGARRARPRK
jgi:predicted nucleotidyltransferase